MVMYSRTVYFLLAVRRPLYDAFDEDDGFAI